MVTSEEQANMRSRGLKIGLVVAAAALTIPSMLSAFDAAAGRQGVESALDATPRSIEGLRRRAADSLTEKRFPQAIADAKAVLARQPLDRTTLRILVLAAGSHGDDTLADDAALAASYVSWRDPYIQARLFDQMQLLGDIDKAAQHADALSRMTRSRETGFESLNELLSEPGGVRAVATRLATRPPWRSEYLADAQEGLADDPERAPAVVAALARTAAPPSAGEVDRLLAALVAQDEGQRAWAIWQARQGRAGAALIDDPDLQSARVTPPRTAAPPFRWSISGDSPIRVLDHRDEAGRPALRVEQQGDRATFFVSRSLLAGPGRYRLAYQAGGEAEALERLHVEAKCTTGAAVRIGTAAGRRPDAAERVEEVDVPVNCGLLRVGFTLESSESATPVELSVRGVSFTPAR